MEWSLLVTNSVSSHPRKFPFEMGRNWVGGRIETAAQAVDRAMTEGSRNPLLLDEKCYLPLAADPNINRWHCHFVHDSGGPSIQDWASRNGTRLNGKRIFEKHSLSLDDVIRVADCEVFVSCAVRVHPSWLTWIDDAVVQFAAEIRETGDFSRLPTLHDKLKDGGCKDVDILNHCLEPHSSRRRCCVVELLLNRLMR